ncbi:Alpha/beta hydrolase fold-1 [Mycena pura]|uniref:Alpha/beta hydrolase fold-1 n=1 Tax=Mycena pura TaxID=153505 RepID=A0AAD6VQW0_9AGAR|nr:Alpha/beta hydrolase fold-1 [Mycena pura]
MKVDAFTLPTPPAPGKKPLVMVAKRYTSSHQTTPRSGVTLLMLHGLGQHKEQWEPVMESLYALQVQSESGAEPQAVREAWAFDWQSHGESAVLNEEALKDGPASASMDRWAAAIASFINSDHVRGHQLVGIGYSMVTTRFFDTCPYVGIVLIEPSLMDPELWDTHTEINAAFEGVTNSVKHRRNSWESKEAAYQLISGRPPWTSYDPRVAKLFVEYAMTTSKDKDGKACVIRSCPSMHEAMAFQFSLQQSFDGAEQMSKLSGIVPIHAILAETHGFMPQAIFDCSLDMNKGRKAASITRVPGTSHTIMQEVPDALGSIILRLARDIIIMSASPQVHVRGRL